MQQIFTPLFTILLTVVNNNSAILIFNGIIVNINFIVQTVTNLLRNCKKKVVHLGVLIHLWMTY